MAKQPNLADEADRAIQRLIEPFAMLYGVQKVYGDKVRTETKQAYAGLKDAHLLIAGVLGAALLRINAKIFEITSPDSSARQALTAAFVIGMRLCEDAIEQGCYLQASALLRQEMEIVAQLKAVRAGARRPNKAPNVRVLEESLAQLYGDLSAATHVSQHWIVEAATDWPMTGDHLPGPTNGTRQFPQFDHDTARRLFSLHLMLMMNLIEEMSIDLSVNYKDEVFTHDEMEALRLALRLMAAEGMVVLGDDPA